MRSGVLVREVPVRVLDLSASGCLVAVDSGVPSGTAGELRLTMAGKAYAEAVRVLRSTGRPGSTPAVTVAGEFALGRRPRTRVQIRSIVPRREG